MDTGINRHYLPRFFQKNFLGYNFTPSDYELLFLHHEKDNLFSLKQKKMSAKFSNTGQEDFKNNKSGINDINEEKLKLIEKEELKQLKVINEKIVDNHNQTFNINDTYIIDNIFEKLVCSLLKRNASVKKLYDLYNHQIIDLILKNEDPKYKYDLKSKIIEAGFIVQSYNNVIENLNSNTNTNTKYKNLKVIKTSNMPLSDCYCITINENGQLGCILNGYNDKQGIIFIYNENYLLYFYNEYHHSINNNEVRNFIYSNFYDFLVIKKNIYSLDKFKIQKRIKNTIPNKHKKNIRKVFCLALKDYNKAIIPLKKMIDIERKNKKK